MKLPAVSDGAIALAAENDYDKRTTFDYAYDRRAGFTAGARWMQNELQSRMPLHPVEIEPKPEDVMDVRVGDLYRHHRSKAVYVVIALANTSTPSKPQFPPTVVYQNIHNNAIFARALSTFTRNKFTPITRESDPITYWAWRHRDAP